MPVRRGRRAKWKRSQKTGSAVLKRTVIISGRRTGVSLQDAFWEYASGEGRVDDC
jgi:predicted DNA-binding ribbon-helix-helix protein